MSESTVRAAAPAESKSVSESGSAGTARQKILNSVLGPALFLVMLLMPIPGMSYEIRCGLGLLLWMAYWWITRPVHLAVTGFLPLATVSVFNFAPLGPVLASYSEELIILLLAANVLTTVWGRWGLDRRIALVSLIGVGTSTTRQIVAWFAIAMILSAFLPNTIVAATMIPIVVAMLRYIGIEDLQKSNLGTALVIAVAWGTSAGGAATPLGGAPNLLTVAFIEQSITGREFLFITWVTRFLPLTLAVMLVTLLYVRVAFKPEIARIEGTRDYFVGQLRGLGTLTPQEKWGFGLFFMATLLAFSRPLYADRMPAFSPAYAFLAMAMIAFVVRIRGGNLMTWEYAQGKMMWGLFYLFAGGTALGRILSETGAASYLADLLIPYARGGGFVAVLVFSAITLVSTQITNNTAAVAVTVPITISTLQSLDINPLPFVYIVATLGNCGFMLPTSAGGPAVAAGYGINLKTMFVAGFWVCLLCLVAVVAVGYLAALYWPAFSTA